MTDKITDKKLVNEEILFAMVRQENAEQIYKWGLQTRTPFEWLAYLTEEVGELSEAISEEEYTKGTSGDVVKEAIQVATLSLKIAEMYLYKVKGEVK